MSVLRSFGFLLGYGLITVVWGTLGLLFGWLMPYKQRFEFIVVAWTRLIMAWLRLTCGITIKIEGHAHIPAEPCVVLVRHESTLETLCLQSIFVPQTTVIKRELLRIPFFGWAYSLLKPIAIDRRDARGALKALVRSGQRRLNDGIWVVLFPEGTRMPPGEPGRFQRGGTALATAANVPVLVVAHDAGRYWPARTWRKAPGIVRVRISPPIETDARTTPELTQEAETWMRNAMAEQYASDVEISDR